MLPYGGSTDPNSGYTGSDTSEERAREADRTGVTARNQRHTLHFLREAGRHGMTYRELGGVAGWHHGQASSSLSILHKAGRIARLTERRTRCLVYVLPEFVAGRDTTPQGQTSTTALLAHMADLLARAPDCGHGPLPVTGCWGCEVKDALRQFEARS